MSRTRVQIQSTLQKISSLNVHRHFSSFSTLFRFLKENIVEKIPNFPKNPLFCLKIYRVFQKLAYPTEFCKLPNFIPTIFHFSILHVQIQMAHFGIFTQFSCHLHPFCNTRLVQLHNKIVVVRAILCSCKTS